MTNIIDLRSDTFTKPTEAMKRFMWDAKVGDDVFDEDPTINLLQEKVAGLFGMEASLFCPSGTMTNQIALKVHTRPGDEIICHKYSHIYNYEGGGLAFNSGCQTRLLEGDKGLIDPNSVAQNINPDDIHSARSSLISMENTSNKGGGSCYEMEALESIGKIAQENQLAYHLDGARLFNALVHKKQDTKDYGQIFDSISICLSKGLGCPVGSLILGNKDFIKEAKRVRKKFGGGMRQAGYLAAAGIYALDHHIHRLEEDHQKAHVLKEGLENCSWVKSIESVETNIIIFYIHDHLDEKIFLQKLEENGIKAIGMGQGKLRFVTHLDVSMAQIKTASDLLSSFK